MSAPEAPNARPAYWWQMAAESLASAESDAAMGRLHGAVNRAYYACFYALTAVLSAMGQACTKHTEARAALHRDLIRTGLLEVDYGRLYNTLYDARHTGDYREFVEFAAAEVDDWVAEASRFVARLQQLQATG